MAEFSSAGYQSVRDLIQANWTFIEVRDNTGTAIVRLPGTDPRVTWTHTAGAQTLKRQVVIKGSDSDISSLLPKTFGSVAIFSVASGGDVLASETFTNFTMESTSDQITLVLNMEVPKVV